jgi:hypothetical protein
MHFGQGILYRLRKLEATLNLAWPGGWRTSEPSDWMQGSYLVDE